MLAVLVVAMVPFGMPRAGQAFAQERVQRSRSILEFFGFNKPKKERLPVTAQKKRTKKVSALSAQRRKNTAVKSVRRSNIRGGIGSAAPASPGVLSADEPAVPALKLENSKSVLVVGDFMAGAVAEGLVEAFADSASVKIVEKWNGSSGFARKDHYDWAASLPALLAETKPSVVVIMIGTNDRQQMLVGGNREQVGSAAWNTEYESRVAAMAGALKAGGVPAIWVGQPALRSSQMTASMLAFNDVYRRNVTRVGGAFVDIWDGFVDENGIFQQSGPDLNGLPARLRASDGISFSKAGKRKAAFYVEKPLRQMLGESSLPAILSPPGPTAADFIGPLLPMPVVITRTDPIAINDPGLDGGTELLGAVPSTLRSPQDLLFKRGIAPKPQPGRVDDFTWKDPNLADAEPADNEAPQQTGATR